MKCPCHHCEDRHNLCWSECEKYTEFVENYRKGKAYAEHGSLADELLSRGSVKRQNSFYRGIGRNIVMKGMR